MSTAHQLSLLYVIQLKGVDFWTPPCFPLLGFKMQWLIRRKNCTVACGCYQLRSQSLELQSVCLLGFSQMLRPWISHFLCLTLVTFLCFSPLMPKGRNSMGLHTFILQQQQQQNIQKSQFSRSVMPDSATPWTAARQASLSITNSQNLLKHVHWVSGAIQPSHPLSAPSPPAFNLSQHHGLFKWVSYSH